MPNFATSQDQLRQYLEVKLVANGYVATDGRDGFLDVVHDLIASYRERARLLAGYLCPSDRRIQDFLDQHFAELSSEVGIPRLPEQSFMLDRAGLARLLSLPATGDEFKTDLLTSYRVRQGVLHNPKSDRRTTAGSFHVAEGGLPIAGDKRAVPKAVFARLFQAAVNPPADTTILPYTSDRTDPAHGLVSLLIRPTVCPAIPAADPVLATGARSMEIRLFAPGTLVSNLDFIESIFGNAGNPHLAENDAALDVAHWTGHTGCIVFAPHLTGLTKRELGLPPRSAATARQQRDRMCWDHPDERYNDGTAFKATCRTAAGVMVTLIADNYFGYGKKEVKTQISYAANLAGLAEEEHAGGALAFPSYALGDEFRADSSTIRNGATWADVARDHAGLMHLQPEGYGIDRRFPTIIYVPEDVHIQLKPQTVSWTQDGVPRQIRLRVGHSYVLPSGYKIRLEQHPGGASWRLVGTEPEGTFCHKPCTVSGGGKSEISKSISDAIIYGPLHINDLEQDLDQVTSLLARDYSDRFQPEFRPDYAARVSKVSRPILSPERSLGSVIKLFTPSPIEFTAAYNAWLRSIPTRILTLLFVIKRFHRAEWGTDWRRHFTVDIVNGSPGHQLKVDNRGLIASYLRIGIDDDGAWRTYKLRQDFIAADKVQMEDDISASVVVPSAQLAHLAATTAANPSVKLVANCEQRLFQRPDDAVHRGQDKQAEADLAGAVADSVFISNFEPLTPAQARELTDDAIGFAKWTAPMQAVIAAAAQADHGFVVSSAHPRLVDGKPSKNPRYLQERPDLTNARGTWLAEVGARLYRRVPAGQPVVFAVNAMLPGRRNNPPEPKAGVRPLAVHGPIHYLELPELFMEFASSLTGKSPSTTGAGSEGALTKGPFNALTAFADLDNALLSMVLCGYDGFTTSAGCVGPHLRVDHDISLLIPEIWARLTPTERSAKHLIAEGHLERLTDFTHDGQRVLASRLGYRITARFVHTFFGKVFDNPAAVFDEAMLKPETQDLACYVDGINNIVEAQATCARQYLDDGAAREASPPLLALLDIMATGSHRGRGIDDPELRAGFTRDAVLAAPWYRARLERKQARDVALWQRHVTTLTRVLAARGQEPIATEMQLAARLAHAQEQLARVSAPAYVDLLRGTIGCAPVADAFAIAAS
jgi:phosphoenolpyruvate carboxykinase (diphosphate)